MRIISPSLTARIAEALCKTCRDQAEETGARRERLARASVGFLARNLDEPAREGPSAVPPQKKFFAGAVGFPTPPRKISRGSESDSALRQAPGGTTEVSSPETGLVFAKAGAPERRKAWGNSVLF